MRHIQDFHSSNLVIRSALLRKLPYQTCSEISDHLKNHNFNLQEMDSTLQYMIGKMEHGRLTPKRRAKGKFHYPTARLFSASLKMKIKIFFLLEIVRNDVKSTKCNYFPFVSILRELAATWKSVMHRGESEARGGKTRVWKPSSGCLWMNTAQYRFAICWSLIFNDSDTFAAFLLKWSAGNGNVYKPHPAFGG